MNGVPLHPLVVHIPLVVGVLTPLVALILFGAIAGRQLHHRVWWLVAFLYLVGFLGAFVAVRTGEQEHDTVHDLVTEQPMHEHEERGEQFRTALAVMLALTVANGLLFGHRRRALQLAVLTILAGGFTAWLGIRVGHSGGLLIYQEGAAAYYANDDVPGPRVMGPAPTTSDTVMARDTAGQGHTHTHEH